MTTTVVTEKVTAPGGPVDGLADGCTVLDLTATIVQALNMSSQRLNTSNNIHSQRMVRQILDKGTSTLNDKI